MSLNGVSFYRKRIWRPSSAHGLSPGWCRTNKRSVGQSFSWIWMFWGLNPYQPENVKNEIRQYHEWCFYRLQTDLGLLHRSWMMLGQQGIRLTTVLVPFHGFRVGFRIRFDFWYFEFPVFLFLQLIRIQEGNSWKYRKTDPITSRTKCNDVYLSSGTTFEQSRKPSESISQISKFSIFLFLQLIRIQGGILLENIEKWILTADNRSYQVELCLDITLDHIRAK